MGSVGQLPIVDLGISSYQTGMRTARLLVAQFSIIVSYQAIVTPGDHCTKRSLDANVTPQERARACNSLADDSAQYFTNQEKVDARRSTAEDFARRDFDLRVKSVKLEQYRAFDGFDNHSNRPPA